MKIAPLPPNEIKRLQILQGLAVIGRSGNSFYQDIATLACTLTSTKLSMISLVDHSTVWVFSKSGHEYSELPRDSAFCSHTILSEGPMVIGDTLDDPRFFDNPYVVQTPHIRFYAGVPLVTSSGLCIGALCVLDTAPRQLQEAQLIGLEALARQIVMRMEWDQTNRRLDSSVNQLQVLLDSISAGILAEDHRGIVTLANDQFLKLFPTINDETFIGQSTQRVFTALRHSFRNPDSAIRRLTTIINQQESCVGEEMEANDGRTFEFDHLPTLDHSALPGYLWVCRDVTDRKNLEKSLDKQKMQMAASAKLAALGEMASGIAHEINNPLSIIQGRSQILNELARRDLLDKAAVVKSATVIEATCNRVAKIVRGLRTFARDGELDPFERVTLNDILQDTLLLCSERLHYAQIELSVSCPETLLIACRPVHISQVLLNLINNAHDAIQELPEKWIRIEVIDLKDSYELHVTDSGNGISPALGESIMRPFFTTKDIGKGSGLGLSISRGIIESHFGTLTIDHDCRNTRFIAHLPKIADITEK